MSKSLIIIDMLNDFFPGGKLACERAEKIIPVVKSLIGKFRAKKNLIIYVNDSHLPEIDQEFKIWGPHALRGTKGAEVIKDITPEKEDYILLKRRYSAFSGTDLNYLLIEKGVKELVLVGLHTHICIKHTAYDAFLNGYGIEVVEDGVESFSKEDHEYGLDYLKKVYGVKILKERDY